MGFGYQQNCKFRAAGPLCSEVTVSRQEFGEVWLLGREEVTLPGPAQIAIRIQVARQNPVDARHHLSLG
jgi:hypothetical protein